MAREGKTDWVEYLPMMLLGVRTAWRVELDVSPAKLTFGTLLHLPGEFLDPLGKNFGEHEFLSKLQEQMNKLTPVQTSNHATLRREGTAIICYGPRLSEKLSESLPSIPTQILQHDG